MMKLLKYDFKRHSNTLLGSLVVLIIIQAALSIIGTVKSWDPGVVIALSIFLYGIVFVFISWLACKNYDTSIKSYARRLLPVRPVWTVISSLVLSWIAILVLFMIFAIHIYVYWQYGSVPSEITNDLSGIRAVDAISGVAASFWLYSLWIITIFLAITIGAAVSIRGKLGAWVGILAYFILQNVWSWLEEIFFGSLANIDRFGAFTIVEGTDYVDAAFGPGVLELTWGPFIFELVIMALMVWGITLLHRKKLEI
ncbi:hypothetical protein D3C73_889970 [compost metagenome]